MTTTDVAELSPQDPQVILAGIKQFGLAADGSDLRDLAVALSRLDIAIDAAAATEEALYSRIVAERARAEKAEARITELEEKYGEHKK